jgi:hypothetical protein
MAYVQKNNPFKLVKRGRKKHARSIRKGVGHVNKEGKTETHKMAYGSGEVDGKTVYRAYPTVTFDDKGKKKDQSYNEAKKAGELYEFKREKRAEKFAAYRYKKGKARREAKRDYKMNKKNK